MRLACLSLILLTACQPTPDPAGERSPIRVGLLPDRAEDIQRARFAPVFAYLEETTGLELEMVIEDNYETMLAGFLDDDIQIALFGGVTYVKAGDAAVPLVLRDVDRQFSSCMVARADDTRSSVQEFAGARFSFGPELSTSGHLMPRYFLGLSGIQPEAHFATVSHSSGHDETAMWTAEARIDIGAVNCTALESFDESLTSSLRVVARTPAYGNYVWAARNTVHPSVRAEIIDAFLALNPDIEHHARLLENLGASAYFPAKQSDFDAVRTAVRSVHGDENADK